jgi:hypothetical protein
MLFVVIGDGEVLDNGLALAIVVRKTMETMGEASPFFY